MSNRLTIIIASGLLLWVFLAGIFSLKNDSATMDEVAHLPAGYSYLTQKDMRLNPEHPPLIKDLAGFPLLFIKGINFPSEIKDWKEDINGQWGFGYNFLYRSGNDADKMIFWSRLPMLLVLILLGFYIFKWAKELLGPKAGLLSLFLFSFSPTFLAHGRLVTTDVGAAAGIFIASYYFVKSLKNPVKKNIIGAGIAFGLAFLAKFTAVLLVPLFGFLVIFWWLIKSGKFFQSLKVLILTFLIGFLLVGIVYQYHVWNYPPERQQRDTEFLLSSFGARELADLTVWMADKPVLRPYAQYLLGLLMVMQRGAGGHTTYFLGEVSAAGWKSYFPIVYLIKEPLTFHILTLIALLAAALLLKKPFWINAFQRLKSCLKNHFPEFAMFIFVLLYWATSLYSNLNIGVRHLLPVFPFTFVLVSAVIVNLFTPTPNFGVGVKLRYLILMILLFWQVISVISVYPHFLSYFNELVGGPEKGHIYTVDSNLDWGQDLKRLTKWVEGEGINKIYVDYFGGGDAQYYLKEKFLPWQGTREPAEFPAGNYLAVSITFLQGGRGEPGPGFDLPTGYYRWLDFYEPVAKIGNSIFVYYIP